MVFVTSKECRDVSPDEAKGYILGYTVGNDLSCRLYQLTKNSGGQFFFAKAFDKFAPIGPALISPSLFASISCKVVTKVNGEVRQSADIQKDMIFSPERVLSHMSQGIVAAMILSFFAEKLTHHLNRNNYSCWDCGHDWHGSRSRCIQ